MGVAFRRRISRSRGRRGAVRRPTRGGAVHHEGNRFLPAAFDGTGAAYLRRRRLPTVSRRGARRMKRISVVIPAHNEEGYIGRWLGSVGEAGELFPRVGFIVTNLPWRVDRVVRFYNKRLRDRREGRQACPVCDLPDGRGGDSAPAVRNDSASHRAVAPGSAVAVGQTVGEQDYEQRPGGMLRGHAAKLWTQRRVRTCMRDLWWLSCSA